MAQSVGVPLSEIRHVLESIPRNKAVSAGAWAEAAQPWKELLDERIALMERLRDQTGFCIGSECLSLDSCPFYNTNDMLGTRGAGPRRWIGTKSELSDLVESDAGDGQSK